MELVKMNEAIESFNANTHGSTDYYLDEVYVMVNEKTFAPISYLKKKVEGFAAELLIKEGYIYDSLDLIEVDAFSDWYEKKFSRKLKRSQAKKVLFLHLPDNKKIFGVIETVNQCYEALREQKILFNGKKLPVQLGEWYAKCIFGLMQEKSTSQRGFDFTLNGKTVEVKVQWGDATSPKGVKLKKALVDLSDYVIIIYMAKNFMIREVCFLDSSYVSRKFSNKGHTVFLKDTDISTYFFSKSNKHMDKVVNSNALMKYSMPNFAMKLTESFNK